MTRPKKRLRSIVKVVHMPGERYSKSFEGIQWLRADNTSNLKSLLTDHLSMFKESY